MNKTAYFSVSPVKKIRFATEDQQNVFVLLSRAFKIVANDCRPLDHLDNSVTCPLALHVIRPTTYMAH